MARKVSKIVIHGNHIEVETDCPDCPDKMTQNVVKPDNKTDDEIEKKLQEKYPWANVSKENNDE